MSGDGQPFIPGPLDDAGLTPTQFRVACHIARRGECFANLATIAETCCVHRDTAVATLRQLVGMGLLTKEVRRGPGATNVYRLVPLSEWPPFASGNGGTGKRGIGKRGAGTKGTGNETPCPRKARGSMLGETKGHKVTPLEVTPLKGERALALTEGKREVGTGDGKAAPTLDEVIAHCRGFCDGEDFARAFYAEFERNGWFNRGGGKVNGVWRENLTFLKRWKATASIRMKSR